MKEKLKKGKAVRKLIFFFINHPSIDSVACWTPESGRRHYGCSLKDHLSRGGPSNSKPLVSPWPDRITPISSESDSLNHSFAMMSTVHMTKFTKYFRKYLSYDLHRPIPDLLEAQNSTYVGYLHLGFMQSQTLSNSSKKSLLLPTQDPANAACLFHTQVGSPKQLRCFHL